MDQKEFETRMSDIRKGIEDAKTEEEVKALEEQAVELRADFDKMKKEEVVKKSAFNPIEARKNTGKESGVKTMNNLEQREAYRAYFEKRDANQTKTTDIVIPTTVLEEVRNKNVGDIFAKTTQTHYPTGVDIAVLDLTGEEADWVSEGSEATGKKLGQTKVSFKQYKLQKKLPLSREAKAMALPEFERNVAGVAVTAITRKIEKEIFVGAGTSGMKGITKETAVASVDYSATYAGLLNIIMELDDEYVGEFYMNRKTYFTLMGMTDDNGQPIARTDAGLDGKPVFALLGAPVHFTDALKPIATASNGDDVIVYGDMSKYVINIVQDAQLEEYPDYAADGTVYRATELLDGKLVDTKAFVRVKKPTPANVG